MIYSLSGEPLVEEEAQEDSLAAAIELRKALSASKSMKNDGKSTEIDRNRLEVSLF